MVIISGSLVVVTVLRYGLPAAIFIAGLALLIVGGDTPTGAGIVLMGVAAIVLLANAFLRLSFHSQDDRAREERARRFFTRHGRWPRGDPPTR